MIIKHNSEKYWTREKRKGKKKPSILTLKILQRRWRKDHLITITDQIFQWRRRKEDLITIADQIFQWTRMEEDLITITDLQLLYIQFSYEWNQNKVYSSCAKKGVLVQAASRTKPPIPFCNILYACFSSTSSVMA